MKAAIGAALVASVLVFAGPAAIDLAAAAPQTKGQAAGTSGVTDFSAQRHGRRRYPPYAYRAPGPYYVARPYYYRPYPYQVPAPFAFGFNFGPYW